MSIGIITRVQNLTKIQLNRISRTWFIRLFTAQINRVDSTYRSFQDTCKITIVKFMFRRTRYSKDIPSIPRLSSRVYVISDYSVMNINLPIIVQSLSHFSLRFSTQWNTSFTVVCLQVSHCIPIVVTILLSWNFNISEEKWINLISKYRKY